jgi:5S rRNA maturation endonuclease (ribonuclease M5)
MAYCICRISKLKNGGSIAASEHHTLRKRETPNADLKKENERFIGNEPIQSPVTLEQEVFARIGEQKIRKNAVLCVEMLLTASPEYFRPDDQGRAGKWEVEQLEQWKRLNRDWLTEQYGDRIVRAELHLDEATPHIHAYLVPLDDQGKLNCKSHFGGRLKLHQFQDSYAKAMEPLGLDRGIKGSRAKHTEVKEYYAAVTKQPDETLTPEEIQHQLADRQIVLKQNADLEQTAQFLSRQNEQFKIQMQRLKDGLEEQQLETLSWKQRYEGMTAQLREIPLAQVAHELGLDPDPRDKHKWRNEAHILNLTGQKFYDFTEMKGGGGAIDLVMYVERCGFGDALHWLQDHFGDGMTLQTLTRQVAQTIQERSRQLFQRPVLHRESWPAVREYLTQTRRLPQALVDGLHQQGLVYADEHQNAVFVRRSLEGEVTGASLRGTLGGQKNTFKGLAYGTRRSQGWFYLESDHPGPVQQVVLCESAIDAMSYKTLNPAQEKTLYLSTDGAGYLPLEVLRSVPRVAIAFDTDEVGEQMAERFQEELPQAQRVIPQGKDWNVDLEVQVRTIQERMQQIQKEQEVIRVRQDKQHGQHFSR